MRLAFFLIVPSVMVAGVLLVHALAKRLGLKIYYTTLAAVALLSYAIIFAAGFLSPVPDKKFLACLVGLVLATALLMTFINNFLIKRQRAAEKNFTEEVKSAYAEEVKKDAEKSPATEIVVPLEKFEWDGIAPEENKSDADDVKQDDTPKKIVDIAEDKDLSGEFPLENVFKPLDDVKAEAIAKALENKNAEPFEKPKIEENFPLQEVFKPLDKINSESAVKVLEKENAAPFEEVKPEENFPLQETFKPLDEVKLEMLEKFQSETKTLELSDETTSAAFDDKISDETTLAAFDDKISDETISVAFDDKISDETISATFDDKISDETTLAAFDDKISDETTSAAFDDKISDETISATVDDKISDETTSAAFDDKISDETTSAAFDDKISDETISAAFEENIETLDDILDKAYDARSKGHIWHAIEHYRKALERYGTDEYAPFVAIDLGNVYKENALYSKAIKTFEEALNLPAVKRNDDVKREFLKNLEYLRVVRDILLKHRVATTPFAKLSKEILQEIDAEFQRTQIHSAQYK